MPDAGPPQEYMTVEIRIALPVDVKALARLSRELQAALFRTGLTYLPPVVRGEPEENIALRGIGYWLRMTADSLTAHAGQPLEVRDIATSLRSKAAAVERGEDDREALARQQFAESVLNPHARPGGNT